MPSKKAKDRKRKKAAHETKNGLLREEQLTNIKSGQLKHIRDQMIQRGDSDDIIWCVNIRTNNEW